MKYKLLEHPAELRLRIYSKTIEELFKNAAEALSNIQKKDVFYARSRKKLIELKREKIKIKSVDVNSLLVDFLSEILAKSQINKCIYYVSSFKLQDSSLEAEIMGMPVERFDEDIKAVTYQDVDIKLKDKVWQTDLVFDI